MFKKFIKAIHNSQELFIILLTGLLLRVAMSPFGTLTLDHNTFVAWSDIVAKNGFANFYSGWSDYLPGYVYVLWLLGHIHQALPLISTHILYKIPSILADITTGYLIYKIIIQLKNKKLALFAAGIYLFNPAIIANSTLWGQVDSFTALFSLSAVYFASVNPIASAICLALGTVIKPQAALATIPILFIAHQNKWHIKKLLIYASVGGATFILAFLPFANGAAIFPFIQTRLNNTLTQYPFTSVNAFNFWGLGGMWKPDTWQSTVGFIVTFISSFLIALRIKKYKLSPYILLAFIFLTGFMFMTRLHERHMLPMFAPLAISIAILPHALFSYILLSIVYLANLYYAHVWISQDFRQILTPDKINLLIFIALAAFINFTALLLRGKFAKFKKFSIPFQTKFQAYKFKDAISPSTAKKLLLAILLFSLLTRAINLSSPKSEYFDEVYHAFTARVLLHNDQKAWEWWNPHPEGFAYEWTHPPFAKEAMWVGMKLFGENPIGWRAPAAAFGLIVVFLIYLIAKELFKSRDIAILSSAFFALDGLPLVLSRIGMNDIYLLCFVLATFYLFLRDKYLLASITFGLALSSKWSSIWLIPILFMTLLVFRKRLTFKYLWFAFIPILVYLASYIPFFTMGHNWTQFVELQKQMWWYHTKLVATHGYSSSWWSWPLMLRPVWLYVSREGNFVSNIYAMSNPLILWMGLASTITCIWWAIKARQKTLLLVIFAYLAFFVTWAASPRIMFFYHFLPSVTFLSILLGYTAKRAKLALPMLVIAAIAFIYFYPHWTGIPIPTWLDNSYYWLESWR